MRFKTHFMNVNSVNKGLSIRHNVDLQVSDVDMLKLGNYGTFDERRKRLEFESA